MKTSSLRTGRAPVAGPPFLCRTDNRRRRRWYTLVERVVGLPNHKRAESVRGVHAPGDFGPRAFFKPYFLQGIEGMGFPVSSQVFNPQTMKVQPFTACCAPLSLRSMS